MRQNTFWRFSEEETVSGRRKEARESLNKDSKVQEIVVNYHGNLT